MSILPHTARSEHDPDHRVHIPRRLLADIVAVVVDALDVDTDQAALVEYLTERFADRVVLVDDQDQDDDQARAEYELDELAMWADCAAADEFAAAAESGVLL